MLSISRYWIFILAALSFPSIRCNPAATVDLPAADLDVKITVIDTDSHPSDGKVPVVMQFFSNGSFVQLAGNAAVTCNGVALTYNGLGYAERIPVVTPGGSYIFRHSRSAVNTSASVVVPSRPVILSPTQNATVTRSASFTTTYVAATSTGVRGSAGDASTGLGGNLEPDNGTYTMDISTLHAGAGSMGLTREFANTLPPNGFKTVEVKYSSGSDFKVTWN